MSGNEATPLITDFMVEMSSYDIGEKIHRDSFGEIYQAVDKGTGSPVLVKRFRAYEDTFPWAMNEVRFLRVKNPLFLEMLGFGVCGREVSIVLRNAANGTLNGVLENETRGMVRPGWDATSKSKCIFGIAAAMMAVHERGFLHGDLKPGNVFLDENFEPLLGGLHIVSEFLPTLDKLCGTRVFAAPEKLLQQRYDYKADVFSFGITVFCLLTGQTVAYSFEELHSPLTQIRPNLDAILGIPPALASLMKHCWDGNPDGRPSFQEILELWHDNSEEYILPGADLAAVKEYESRILATGILS